MILFTFCFLLFTFYFLFFSTPVFAWGPGVHLFIGRTILNSPSLISSQLCQLLNQYWIDFLYGCIICDFFIGKGMLKRLSAERWDIGFSMLFDSSSKQQTAFSYGFLSHLANDVIAHNFFIPSFIIREKTTNRLGHLNCEITADHFVEKLVLNDMKIVIKDYCSLNDAFLLRHAKKRKIFFNLRKKMFLETMSAYYFSKYKNFIKNQFLKLKKRPGIDEIKKYIEYSLFCSIDILKNRDKSQLISYDPTGLDFLKLTRKLKKIYKKDPAQKLFVTPSHIKKISIFDRKI
ncbi:MAG: zinc dependent phospholipase C family protein [Candidatus Hydrogenedentota bacterium]